MLSASFHTSLLIRTSHHATQATAAPIKKHALRYWNRRRFCVFVVDRCRGGASGYQPAPPEPVEGLRGRRWRGQVRAELSSRTDTRALRPSSYPLAYG